ncbi:hypothetical protein GCM10027048_20240 [Hymenobacter coalescens]
MLPLLSIPPLCGANVGGLLGAVRVWPVANVRRLPAYAGARLTQPVELHDLENYADLFFPEKGAGFDEPQGEDDQGTFFTPKLQLGLPKDDPTVAEALWRLRQAGGRFLAVYQDGNGFTKLVGSPEYPMQLLDDFGTGQSGGDRNAHQLTLSGRTPEPAPFYLHMDLQPQGGRRAFSPGFSFGFS